MLCTRVKKMMMGQLVLMYREPYLTYHPMLKQTKNLMIMLSYPMVVIVSTLKSKAEGKSKTPVTHWNRIQIAREIVGSILTWDEKVTLTKKNVPCLAF